MDNMRKQAERFGAKFKSGRVSRVDLQSRPFRLFLESGETLISESVILSTGATANLLHIPYEHNYIGRGVSTCTTCDGFFFRGKKVIVVGGGDSAMEEAHFLTRFAKEVRVVHRRNQLKASQIMQDRARQNEKIEWSLDRIPLEVIPGEKGVSGLKVRDNQTGDEEIFEADEFS